MRMNYLLKYGHFDRHCECCVVNICIIGFTENVNHRLEIAEWKMTHLSNETNLEGLQNKRYINVSSICVYSNKIDCVTEC